MKCTDDIKRVANVTLNQPPGEVLKGQYTHIYRSKKGKIKGLVLHSGTQTYTIKLPKYLRPLLVRELAPNMFLQVWAYPEKGIWQGLNLMPLSAAEISDLQATWEQGIPSPSVSQATPSPTCIKICRKGKCYKQGSRQIVAALEAEVASNPKLQHVSIEAVGCMKACKKGPNLKLANSGKLINRVTPEAALEILAEFQ
jgi:hypothetical protein